LSFLKSPLLLAVVEGLDGAASVREACLTAGVGADQLRTYRTALATLAASHMIRPRDSDPETTK
jgi:putative mycofactocin binding protein MftB